MVARGFSLWSRKPKGNAAAWADEVHLQASFRHFVPSRAHRSFAQGARSSFPVHFPEAESLWQRSLAQGARALDDPQIRDVVHRAHADVEVGEADPEEAEPGPFHVVAVEATD